MKLRTAFIVGCLLLLAIGDLLTLFFGLRILSLYANGQLSALLFNQSPLRSTSSVLSFGVDVVCLTVGLLAIMKSLQIAVSYLRPSSRPKTLKKVDHVSS